MAVGLLLLAGYVYRGQDDEDPGRWVPGFAATGLVATAIGTNLSLTWPLPGPYNATFGEPSVLLGIVLLAGALALARRWPLHSVAWYACTAGLVAVVLGVRIANLGLTAMPPLTAVGFILAGLGGLLAPVVTIYWRECRGARLATAAVLTGSGAIWLFTALMAYWDHLARWAAQ